MFDLTQILVKKKDNTLEPYESDKLLAAVNKSAVRARGDEGYEGKLTDDEAGEFLALIENDLCRRTNNVIKTSVMHALVEKYLKEVAPDVADAYTNYHSFRMGQAKAWERIYGKCSEIISPVDTDDDNVLALKNQNANADSSLASTKKAFFGDYTSEEYYENFFLTVKELQAVREGFIYVHDRNARLIYPLNCCLFNIAYVMEHGFEMNGVWYNKPTTLEKAFDVMGDLILINASQQYGGFTTPRVDTIIAPYAQSQYEALYAKYTSLGIAEETAKETAKKEVIEQLYDGFQGLEMKLNTVASSRGDYPFTTLTLGLDTSEFGRLAAIACFNTRKGGQGKKGKKKPVLFPKLVFLYDKDLHSEGCVNYDVFEAALECSSKCMYPDWLSLTGEGYVPSMYKKYKEKGVISPMGCRAFLSPWYERGGEAPEDDNDMPVFEGRFNIGAVSLNLPMILAKSQKEGTQFYDELDYYLGLIRNIHCRTYEYIGNMKASCNPIACCYGGLYGGHLKPNERIAPMLKSATASFGITALNELQQQYNRKSIYEDGEFALEVLKYINEKITEFKKEDHHLYAVYGTPAESLCYKQINQYRAMFGIVKGVSDRAYVSNSFHCHVTENISPIEKQNSERRFWDYCNGGKIQYCRYNLGYNKLAIKTLVLRAMEFGFYEGINLSLNYCDDCGYEQVDMGIKCPKCGGYHITEMDRMNGYIGITKIGSETTVLVDDKGNCIVRIKSRYAPPKNKEIMERVSM